MKKSLENISKEIDNFFRTEPTSNQKAWGIINQFYHLVLTYMDENDISKAGLARKLGKSRSVISQMFNKTPNISIKKMVEIADAVGLEFSILPKYEEVKKIFHIHRETETKIIFVPIDKEVWNKLPSGYTPLDRKLFLPNAQYKSRSYSTSSYNNKINAN